MNEFGNTLRNFRRNGIDPERGGPLTQERFGELIGRFLNDLGVTGAAVSNWEKGRSSPSQNDRPVLIAMVKALHLCGGIRALADANRLLAAGNYLTLLPAEIQAIESRWADEASGASAETQVAPPAPVSDYQWARLKTFLPEPLYRQVELAPKDTISALCLHHLKQLLSTVATYLPHHLALELLQHPRTPDAQAHGTFLTGTLLFADVSGFTHLSEQLRQKGGKEGAEEVTRIINEFLEVMLGIIFRHGGQLIKFGGDAMLCLFTGENQGAMQAIWAAWAMKAEMSSHFATVKAMQEIYPLWMKVGHSSGLLFAASVGSETHLEYIITGSAVEQTARAESTARQDQIIVSAETYKVVQSFVQAEEVAERKGYFQVTAVPPAPDSPAQDSWERIQDLIASPEWGLWDFITRLEAFAPYLPMGLLPQLVYDPWLTHLTGQHRQVTVLFANFIGMSEVINAYGPGNAPAITGVIREYFQLMQEEAHYYGGVTNKVDLYDQGDKLMVLFGAPMAHERDARRAALTALAMQQALSRLTDPIAAVFLSQRIGIHTGFVFAGNIGSDRHHRREYTVMGDTVNLAARLMSAAPPGEIWVSGELWRQLALDFEAHTRPLFHPKGMRETVPVYRLLAAQEHIAGERPKRALQSTLVGRESEMQTLLNLTDGLLFGEGKKFLAMTGDGGVGKTRLVLEWQKQVNDVIGEPQGSRPTLCWLSGHGRSYGQRTNGIFIEIMEQFLGFEDGDPPARRWNTLGQVLRSSLGENTPDWSTHFMNQLAYLGNFLGFDLNLRQGLQERVSSLEPETLQLQTWLALADVLAYAAKVQPTILVLEDLHWADASSLDILDFLADKLDDRTPLLFCLVYRAQKDRRIWQAWQTLVQDYPYCQEIHLQELPPSEGQRLLMNLLDAEEPLDEALVSLVLEETDGNPLYMEEVLHRLIADGLLELEAEGWKLTRPITRTMVPNTLYQVIQSRIDDLDFSSPGARRVLWLASILGRTFTEDALRHLFERLGREAAEFQRHLRELGNAALLERARIATGEEIQPGYKFRHGLVQQVAYENMPVAHRRQYHGDVAAWLESTYADHLQPHYGLLAEHYDHADNWSKAFRFHVLAGQQDARAYANARARDHLARALQLAPEAAVSSDDLAQVHFELGRALAILGEASLALEHLHQAYEQFGEKEAANQAERARACYEIGRLHERQMKDLDSAWAWRERGLALLPAEPTPEAAMLYALGSVVRLRQGRLAEADHEATRTLEAASAVYAPAELSLAHRMLSISLRSQGNLAKALEHCQQSLALCEQAGDLIGAIKNTTNLGILHFELDDWPAAREAYQQAIQLLERAGDQYQLGLVHTNLADLYYHLGDLTQSEQHAQQALRLAQKMDAAQQMVTVRVILAMRAWRQNDHDQALVHLAEAGKLAEGAELFQPTVARWLAQVRLSRGDLAYAREALDKWIGGEAEVLADEAEPIQILYAQILASQGETGQAIDILQGSLQRLEDAGMRYQHAQAQLALAQILAGREPQNARHLAKQAQAVFAKLSARLDEADAIAFLTA